MIAFGIVFVTLVVAAIVGTVVNLKSDGYRRVPTAEIRRQPEQSFWR